MPRLRAYRPGDCLHLDLPQLGLDTDAIILNREIDPGTMTVKLTLMGETPAQHAYALGETGVAPPTPALGQTAQARDETAAGTKRGSAYRFASKRSEEHTSELQSLMRTPYAIFCLNKKT